ncbi:hypothetical protein [Rubrivirga sp.]|uniref:hypothetical protein n=1 Tax=Rubrivirga sp. TaxID=1885344 RepID=UPI003C755082
MDIQRKVGRDVAARVADRLEDGDVLGYTHRDYCGMGVEQQDGAYVHGPIWDGWVNVDEPPGSEDHCGGAVFETRDAFVGWLAVQTDHSLSGHDLEREFYRDNQRLTVARVRAFAAGADGRAPQRPVSPHNPS